jgi:Yip1 domain
MTTPPAADAKAPSWEDYIEIFYAPSRVFARRGSKWGGPFLVLLIAVVVVVLATYSLMRPLLDAEGQRAMADRMAELTPEQREQAQAMAAKFAWLGPVTLFGIHILTPLILGIVLWLVGKLVGATQALGAAFMVATFSYFPRVLALPIVALQAAILPEEKLWGFGAISFSPARFMDPATTNYQLIVLLLRFDLFVLWTTFLLALGLKVTGKISTDKAVIAGVILWVIGTLQPLLAYLRG